MSTMWDFGSIENNHTLYRGKDSMILKIDSEKKKMLPLTKEELKLHQDVKVCYICRKRILNKFTYCKNYGNVYR